MLSSQSKNEKTKNQPSLAAVKERPILFKGAIVRAILASLKTETRRIVKPQPTVRKTLGASDIVYSSLEFEGQSEPTCPYGEVGDQLWVRETFWEDSRDKGSEYQHIAYDATPNIFKQRNQPKLIRASAMPSTRPGCSKDFVSEEDSLKNLTTNKFWSRRPSIFLPRWASRVVLEITEIRVEQLHAIDNRSATAEGITHMPPEWLAEKFPTYANARAKYDADVVAWDQVAWDKVPGSGAVPIPPVGPTRVERYAALWDSINGKTPGKAWGDNPYVWVVTFKVIEGGASDAS